MTATTAIVIGTGIGGLVCTEVLCNHFDSVLVLEKDTAAVDLLNKTSLDAAKLESRARPGVLQVCTQHAVCLRCHSVASVHGLWHAALVMRLATCILQTTA